MTIADSYNGSIQSESGFSVVVSTVFNQTTQPDANGTYHLQGNSTFGGLQACISNPVLSDSSVTGSTLSATYAEAATGTSVKVAGTFNPDATILTLTNYAISGGTCDSDTGNGTLTRQ